MAAATEALSRPHRPAWQTFDFGGFVQDHITRTWVLTTWLIVLAWLTLMYVLRQFNTAPLTTAILTGAWLAGLVGVAQGALRHRLNPITRWLKSGLYSSITNSLLTLLLALFIAAALRGFWGYAVTRATFDPAVTAPEFRDEHTGATWGVIAGAWKLLMTGTLPVDFVPRVWLAVGVVVALSLISLVVYRPGLRERLRPARYVVAAAWLLLPPVLYIFLAGLDPSSSFLSLRTLASGEALVLAIYAVLYWQRVVRFRLGNFALWALGWPALYLAWRLAARSGAFPPINVDNWGGLMFTMIVSVFAIVVSFPLGVALALGRRSTVQGIPGWIVWPAAMAAAVWGLFTSTAPMLDAARNSFERAAAFWPVLIPLAAYAFLRFFKGNVVAAASTVYIEVIRGVPLITVLFTAIIMAPLFFPQGLKPKNAWAVMVGFTLFTAAYLAENVRGGLQAIPRGQYEAADSIGLNTLQKMRFIILPQALRAVIPAIVGLFIGVFKDSSLVAVVGLFDLLGIIPPIISNPQWLGLRTELYIFAAAIYFLGSYAMSWYSQRLEVRLGVGER